MEAAFILIITNLKKAKNKSFNHSTLLIGVSQFYLFLQFLSTAKLSLEAACKQCVSGPCFNGSVENRTEKKLHSKI